MAIRKEAKQNDFVPLVLHFGYYFNLTLHFEFLHILIKKKLIINFNIYSLILIIHFIIIKFEWGLGIGDWGLGIGDWAQSPIPNPQSPIPNPQSPIPKIFYNNNNSN